MWYYLNYKHCPCNLMKITSSKLVKIFYCSLFIIYSLLCISVFTVRGQSDKVSSQANKNHEKNCIEIDELCLTPYEIPGYESIKALHMQLDDDQSGDIDLSESVDFLREELNYTKGLEKRQKAFHHNDDQHISVQELWRIWLANEVHNWTVEQTVAWLCASVELSQYADTFYENAINGSMLPRLATNNDNFLTRILGIKSSTHRSKISIKAMDIVLFGPPKDSGSVIKDVFIASLLGLVLILLYKFVAMSRRNGHLIKKMDHEMESLQEELKKFYEDKSITEDDFKKEQMDKDVTSPYDDIALGESASVYRDDYADNDIELDSSSRNKLQLWLQLGYERERVSFQKKIEEMERRISGAKESCEKLRLNKKNLFGALSFIHGKLESKGLPIIEARAAFEEIQQIDKEMKLRWHSIENILNFDIIKNQGLTQLEFFLEPDVHKYNSATTSTVVQHLLKSQSALMFLTMGGYSGYTGDGDNDGTSHAGGSMSVRSTISDDVRLRKVTPWGGGSTTDSYHDSNRSPWGSARGYRPSQTTTPVLQQSHTVESGLYSSVGSELDVIPRSSSCESRPMGTRDFSMVNNAPRIPSKLLNGSSVCDFSSLHKNDSCNFTVGDNQILIGNGDPAKEVPLRTYSPRRHPTSVTTSVRIPNSNSSSQQLLSDKNVAKSSSEPSLEIPEVVSPLKSPTPEKKKKMSSISKSKNLFNVFRSKSDKTKKTKSDT